MTPIERILDFILNFRFMGFYKIVFSLAFLVYILFALVVVRQVNLMVKTLIVPVDLYIKVIVWLHLGLAIFAFILALIIL
jgi:hypothetical protein